MIGRTCKPEKKRRPRRNAALEHPNSTFWKKKADDMWKLVIKAKAGFRCELSLRSGRFDRKGRPLINLHAHHLIERAQIGYRYELNNGICLYADIHGAYPKRRNHQYNAHGTDAERKRFEEIVEKMCPEKYTWWQAHKEVRRRNSPLTYKQHYELLKDIFDKLNMNEFLD